LSAGDPIVNLADLGDFWDEYSRPYCKLHHSPIYMQFIEDTLRLGGIRGGERCLDLGCGPGHFALALSSRGCHVTAVDYSEGMLACARRHLRDHPRAHEAPGINLLKRDALGFLKETPDGSFDIVLASLFLAYVAFPDHIAVEALRLLRPGGRFVMSNPVPEPNFTRVFSESGLAAWRHFLPAILLLTYSNRLKKLARKGEAHFFTETETRELLLRAGYDPPTVRVTDSFARTVYLAVGGKRTT